ncbi:MAG: RluA family pseudouridine synthase [Spirochaetaceae bacterium]|nr:RluA family pseudouridine synthase [Spirochaetaceae bacterium]
MENGLQLYVCRDDESRRLDRILRIAMPDVPLSAIFRALRKGQILVNGKAAKPDYRCREGDRINCCNIDYAGAQVSSGATILRQPSDGYEISLASLLLEETKDLLFINKPMGMLVHGGEDSLEPLVRAYLEPVLAKSLSFSPGPLHRLDRNTSGIIAFSKTLAGAREFSAALRAHRVAKTYLAILEGRLAAPAQWSDQLSRDEGSRKSSQAEAEMQRGGAAQSGRTSQAAESSVIPIASSEEHTLALFRLGTGRTHQIRAQSAIHGHPLQGDVKYGAKRSALPFYLHAIRMELRFCSLEGCPRTVQATLPDYILKNITLLFNLQEKEVYSILDTCIDNS